MKVLVTGGTGYIGSHTTVELIEKGYDVVIVDNLSNSKIEVVENITKITGKRPLFEKIDICNKTALELIFKKHNDLQAVIHFAAYKSVKKSVIEPLKYYYNNLNSMINLLDMMIQYNIKNLVFSSSCTVYGQPKENPVTENTPFDEAYCAYGHTKQICEKMIRNVDLSGKKISAIMLRYFNPIGAHKSAYIGELPLGVPDNLVPYITQTAAGIYEYLRVFGSDYNTPDGTCIRDYIHIEDLAEAHVVALNRLLTNQNKHNCEVFNLGNGKGYSVLEIIKTFEKVNKIKLNYKLMDRRPGDVEQIWADVSYANKELNWKAKRTLDDMLYSAWQWEKKYRNIN